MRDFLWNNFFLFIFLITQTSLFAFDSFPWSKSKGVSSVAPFIYVLEDKESLINNEDIFNNKLNKEFKKNNKDTVRLGLKKSTYWMILDFDTDDNKNGSFIEFNSTQIDKIEVYFLILENKNNCPSNLEFKLISNQCIVSKFNFDINKTNSVKPIKDRFLVFPIPDVTENSKIRTVIKIKSDYSLLFRVKFFEKYNYKFSKEKEYLFIGFFYGFIFIMMIYSLFSYILMKERLYFYFFIYTVSLILLDISITGSIIIFVDISNWILKNSKILSMPFAMFSIALLVKKVLSLEEVYKIEKSLIEVARFIPAFVLGYILILDNSNSIQLLFLSIMTFSCILIGITIRPSFKGNKLALLVLSSFFPLLILSINNILVNFWVIPVEFYIWNTIKITGAFQVVVFAFALSYKLRIEQGEIKHKENQIETAIKEKTGVLSKTIQKLEKKENEFNLELKLAHELQNEMVPAEKGVYPLINYKYYYEFPVTIGGDFFDIIVRKDDSIGVYIADASGHGIAAALLTFMYRTGFSNSIINTNSPQEMLQEINSQATNVMTTHNYMTCFLVFLDTKGNMTYSSAGHRPAFIYRRKQNVVEILATKGFFLGMDKNIFSIEEKKTKIDIGDRILLYTDGILEAENSKGEKWTPENLIKVFSSTGQMSIDGSINYIKNEWKKFLGNSDLKDDSTIFLVEYTGESFK